MPSSAMLGTTVVQLGRGRGALLDNCLHSTRTTVEAKALIDNLRQILLEGGFDIRQWANNVPGLVKWSPLQCSNG